MDTRTLEGLLDDFQEQVEAITPLKTRWRPVWEQIRGINDAFKETRFPARRCREETWARFQSLVGCVKEIQSKETRLRESMTDVSQRHRDEIVAQASAAIPPCGFAEDLADVFLLPVNMAVAVVGKFLPGSPVDEHKEMLKACSASMSRGWELLGRYKHEMLGRHKQEAFNALISARDKLQYAWDQWKESQREAYEARCRAREEREGRREVWRERTESNIGNLEDRLGRLLAVLSHKEAHLEDLCEKRDTAWTDDFRECVEGWIDEEEDDIREVREKIERVQGWIEEKREQLQH